MTDNQGEKNSQKLIRLREVIDITGLNNKGLAEKLEVSPSLISDILNERKLIPKTLGQKLEDSFGINRRWFDHNEGSMYQRESILLTEPEVEYIPEDNGLTFNVDFRVTQSNLKLLGDFMSELKKLTDKYNIKTK